MQRLFPVVCQCKVEYRTLPGTALSPHLAAVAVNNTLYGRQSYTNAFELILPVQALKRAKHVIAVRGVETRAIVAYEIHGFTLVVIHANLDFGVRGMARVFPGIIDQILHDNS